MCLCARGGTRLSPCLLGLDLGLCFVVLLLHLLDEPLALRGLPHPHQHHALVVALRAQRGLVGGGSTGARLEAQAVIQTYLHTCIHTYNH